MTIEPGLYRHWKGGLYQVIAIGRDEGSLAPMVIYQNAADRTKWWVRPYASFAAEDMGPKKVPRFVRLYTWP